MWIFLSSVEVKETDRSLSYICTVLVLASHTRICDSASVQIPNGLIPDPVLYNAKGEGIIDFCPDRCARSL